MRLIEREIFKAITSWIVRPEIVVITGSRQVGKTTLLKMLLDSLDTQDKIYFDLEDFQVLDICNSGADNFVNYLKLQGYTMDSPLYLAIDEIQYLDNPSNFLKLLHDRFPNLKLFVTGSSSMEIRRKFKDSLAGRKIVFELNSFSFSEFLNLRDENTLNIKKNIGDITELVEGHFNPDMQMIVPQLNPLLYEYITFGGYPKPIQENNVEMKISLIKEIYNSYVRKDIKDIGHIRDVYAFNNLLKVLASQIGGLINYKEVSNTLNLNLLTLRKYIFLLENTFIISLCHPYFKNKRKEISKMPKLFFQDTGLRNSILAEFQMVPDRIDWGNLLENFIFMELKRKFTLNENLFFWRTVSGAEIDFVIHQEGGKLTPVEVKGQSFGVPRISRSYRNFINTYRPRNGIVFNPNFTGTIEYNGCTVYFVPAFAV